MLAARFEATFPHSLISQAHDLPDNPLTGDHTTRVKSEGLLA